jgi:biopolymer transport protein ExbB
MMLVEYMMKGGPVMWLIFLTSLVAAAISIERFYHYRRAQTDHRKLLADVKELLADDLIYKAMARCDEDHGPVAHVLKAVLKNKDRDSETIRDAVDVAGLEEVPRLERRNYALGTLANVATLLGLLGTILGMIITFAAIAETQTGIVNVHVLASGIWTAMLTTAFGLMVAIPTTLMHAWLTNEVKKFAIAMEHSAAELVHFIEHRPGKSADEI